MTSPLRRKRRTTARVPSTPARKAAKAVALAMLGLLLLVGGAGAQDLGRPVSSPYSTWPPTNPAASPQLLRIPATAPRPAEPARPAEPIQRTFYQPPRTGTTGTSDEVQGYEIQLEPPGLERL